MYALVDANTFYASCHRAFNPSLRNKPVVVLSNNDGCVIALTSEAKALGIKMGVPAYQVEQLIEEHRVMAYSSNYVLYGDMSNRIMMLLSSYVENIEIYSIDEAFLDMSGYEMYGLEKYGREIVRSVVKGTGIPVSMGIASTKTLAKVANKFAKRYPGYKGVCIIDTDEKRVRALELTKIRDVWGIGRRIAAKLEKEGIVTAYDFSQMPRSWVRKHLTVTGERTWKELNGEPCIEMELVSADKKQICTSRSFGVVQTRLEGLEEAVSNFASLCAQKLRSQKSCAVSLLVFMHTNSFRKDLPQYAPSFHLTFPVPTNSQFEIVKYALIALRKIYKEGYRYKKAGVIITEAIPDSAVQANLFDEVKNRDKQERVMKLLDKYNCGFTRNKIMFAVQLETEKWRLKNQKKSPHYTTDLNELMVVKCK